MAALFITSDYLIIIFLNLAKLKFIPLIIVECCTMYIDVIYSHLRQD
jgi:hypothetical protein